MHLGIDYGSKLAGTTAICYERDAKLFVIQSQKKQDADLFIKKTVKELKPTQIFIDAPLSLPAAYFGRGDDYFYRACDRELKAMSPMFLGGLTARAMKLTDSLRKQGLDCYESYPAALVREYEELASNYNKKSKVNTQILKILYAIIGMKIETLVSYHQIDAVLCWFIGKRYLSGEARAVGEKDEGQIVI